MHFTQLLHQRAHLLRQARLANLAYAYERVSDYARRIARARLRGAATLRSCDPAADRFWPELVAEQVPASAVEEHFLEEDVVELEEIFRFLREEGIEAEDSFEFADLAGRLLPVMRRELVRAGVALPEFSEQASGAPESRA